VGFQIALATLLSSPTGLHSIARRLSPSIRIPHDHVLLAAIVLPQNRYPAGANIAFHQR